MRTNRLDSCESFSAILYFYCAQGNSSLVIGVYYIYVLPRTLSTQKKCCILHSVSKILRNFAISYLLYPKTNTQHYLESNSVGLHHSVVRWIICRHRNIRNSTYSLTKNFSFITSIYHGKYQFANILK